MKKIFAIFLASFFLASTAGAQGSPTLTLTGPLYVGQTDPQVEVLQRMLEASGFLDMPAGVSYGYFGSLTYNALHGSPSDLNNRSWRRARGIFPNDDALDDHNILSTRVRNALNAEYARIASGLPLDPGGAPNFVAPDGRLYPGIGEWADGGVYSNALWNNETPSDIYNRRAGHPNDYAILERFRSACAPWVDRITWTTSDTPWTSTDLSSLQGGLGGGTGWFFDRVHFLGLSLQNFTGMTGTQERSRLEQGLPLYWDNGVVAEVGPDGNYVCGTPTTPTATTTPTIPSTETNTQIQTIINQITAIQNQINTLTGSTGSTYTPSTATDLYALRRTLRRGSAGSDVITLQRTLEARGYLNMQGLPYGYFGSLTQEALKRYQTANNLTSDGVMNTATMNALIAGGVSAPPVSATPTTTTLPTTGTSITPTNPVLYPTTFVPQPTQTTPNLLNLPVITSVTPSIGGAGSTIVIQGTNLGNVQSVTLSDANEIYYSSITPTSYTSSSVEFYINQVQIDQIILLRQRNNDPIPSAVAYRVRVHNENGGGNWLSFILNLQ